MAPMAKTFKAVANKVVKNRSIKLGFVESTDKWKRIQLSSKVQNEFNKIVEDYANSIKPDAVGVYMQETPHQSEKDARDHFTAVQVDKNGKVLTTSHFAVKKK
ncbi:hypothetical protein INS49_003519 [Diaporthe citri]|uniref:uncharacterized protein n=1 Tax=Diaporthe citri TaxID=83186 RepID=UPI001C7E3E95|nr:uncharacterized protein INS49_003519 [Diaporthe citri]KAG6355557.1 hypothetical protein INS49_003519 [Diaporthe citri]